MDGRLWIFLIISLFFWGLYIPNHRNSGMSNKIRVPRILAMVAGSRDEYVNWRSLSFQLGSAVFFLSHLVLLKLHVENFMWYGGALTTISILGVQLLIKLIYRGTPLE
jgi:hypothetical protein